MNCNQYIELLLNKKKSDNYPVVHLDEQFLHLILCKKIKQLLHVSHYFYFVDSKYAR